MVLNVAKVASMAIWWAAGFSTAAIRIIDDDARGTCCVIFPLRARVEACQWMVATFKSTSSFASFARRSWIAVF